MVCQTVAVTERANKVTLPSQGTVERSLESVEHLPHVATSADLVLPPDVEVSLDAADLLYQKMSRSAILRCRCKL